MSYDLRLIDRPRARSVRKNKCSDRAVDAPRMQIIDDRADPRRKDKRTRSTGSPWAVSRPERETSDRELCKRSESFSGYACLHGMHDNSSGCLLGAITGVLCTYRERFLLYNLKSYPLLVLCSFVPRAGVYWRAKNVWIILIPALCLKCVSIQIIYSRLAINCFLSRIRILFMT